MLRRVALFSAICWLSVFQSFANGQELVQAPEGFVKFKLSNVRVERGFVGEKIIVFDYKRTKEGKGVHEVQLAARTDDGRLGIMGLSFIDDSGTIRLKDQMPGFARAMGRREKGIELFFVVGSGRVSHFMPYYLNDDRKEYLVSNVVRSGTLNSKVSARPLNKEEKAAFEKARKESLPPEDVPSGYKRGTPNTELVPGVPIKIGQRGKWVDGVVVSLPSSTTVKVKLEKSNYLRNVKRDQWIAVANDVAKKIKRNPSQFKSDFKTLPGGNLVLDAGVQPLQDSLTLPKGTPLMYEKYSKWEDVYFLSSDNVSVRALRNEFGKPKVELIKKEKLAIRDQTLEDLKRDSAKEAFAANVEGWENKVAGLSKFPSGGTSMKTNGSLAGNRIGGGLAGGGAGLAGFPGGDEASTESKAEPNEDDAGYPLRTWSDKTGKFKIEARLISKNDKQVELEKDNGKTANVPVDKLSAADVAYLKSLDVKKEDNPFASLEDDKSATSLGDRYSSQTASSSASNWNYRVPLKTVGKFDDLGWGAKSVAISPDNSYLVIGRAGSEVTLCDLKKKQVVLNSGRMDHMGDVTAAKFSPNGKFLIIGGSKGTVEVYSVGKKGKLKVETQFAPHGKEVMSIAFSADSKFVLTGGADKVAQYWEVKTGRQIDSIKDFDGKVKGTCIRPSDKMLLATDGKTLVVYDPAAKKVVRRMEVGRSAHSQAAAISPNGLLLAIDDSYDIKLWNLVEYQEMPKIKGTDIPWTIVFAPDSQHLFSGHNGVVNVWDAKTQSRVTACPVGSSFYVQALGVSPDGSMVSCSSAFKEVTVLKAAAK